MTNDQGSNQAGSDAEADVPLFRQSSFVIRRGLAEIGAVPQAC